MCLRVFFSEGLFPLDLNWLGATARTSITITAYAIFLYVKISTELNADRAVPLSSMKWNSSILKLTQAQRKIMSVSKPRTFLSIKLQNSKRFFFFLFCSLSHCSMEISFIPLFSVESMKTAAVNALCVIEARIKLQQEKK